MRSIVAGGAALVALAGLLETLDNIDYDAETVPEPTTLLLFAISLAAAARLRRREIPVGQARHRSR